MSFWTLARIAQALGAGPSDGRPIAGISTDTRSVKTGECFLALRGETFDGHAFLDAAVKAGAAALIVDDARQAVHAGVPVFAVDDTLVALGQLARYRRDAWGKPVVAVGGSNGKTSTKELLRAVLGSVYQVHATTGNLNNRIGVPLTLLALDDWADVAVVECGTNVPGEVALLRDIVRPSVAVVTTVQEEHLEGLGDLAGVLEEELSLLVEVPVAVVPAAEPDVVAGAKARAARVLSAGLERSGADVEATAHGLNANGSGWLECEGTRIESPLAGEHNLRNLTLALAVGRQFGVSAAQAAVGVARMTQPNMRSAIAPLGRALLINDAYNANPGSARAAIALLRDVGAGRQRVAILGTMRELGAQAPRAHRDVAEAALASGVEVIAGLGDFAPALTELAPGNARVVVAPDVDELWELLRPRLQPDAAILLKASRGVKLERMLPHLTSWATT